MKRFFLLSLLVGVAVAIYRKLKADRDTSTYELDAGPVTGTTGTPAM